VFPVNSLYVCLNFAGLLFFCCTGFSVYALIARGWSSNSNYSVLGALRGVAQTISYEVRLALIFISFIFILGSFSFNFFLKFQIFSFNFFCFFSLFLCWSGSALAETNRTPFDFAEGESELVSGFNIEYGRGGFALLFLAEYGRIIFISYLISLIFFSLEGIFLCWVRFLGCFFCF
jgi:NADH-ubiquinone oxidoreductase chain 1